MRLFPIGCALILTACSPSKETVMVTPDVGADLREPCEVEVRAYDGLSDVALILGDHVEALDCANGKIEAIDDILTRAENAAKKPS